MGEWLILVGFIASISGAIVTYKIGKRKTSGSIDTSDAAVLWSESKAMRKELRDEVIALRDEIEVLKDTISDLEKEKIVNENTITRLRRQISTLESRIKKMEKSYGKVK